MKRDELLVLFLIIAMSAFLRFYRLPEYMTFLGDEGRDAIVVRDTITGQHRPLLGPPASIGNVYLGPLYYYMMALPMTVFWMNPVAASAMVALIGVGTVVLIYYLARQWFGFLPAILSASLYAISPVAINYSRFSWNPNPLPFFSLVTIVGLHKAHSTRNFLWLILTGVSLGAALQMHYLALILIPILSIVVILTLLSDKGRTYRRPILGISGAIIGFVLVMFPLILFDIRHDFMNLQALKEIFFGQDKAISDGLLSLLSKLVPIYRDKLTGRYLAGENKTISTLVAVAVLVPLAVACYRQRRKWPYFVLGIWLVGGIIGLSLYKQEIFDHYLGFVSPAPYLLLGGLISMVGGRLRILCFSALIIVLGVVNFLKSPFLELPNNQLARTQLIASYIIDQSEGRDFNFALIAKRNYDSAYQFYLDLYGHKPRQLPFDVTDQLFVVCEDEVCNPIGHPKYEIAAFGWAKVAAVSDLLGVKVYRLVANPSGKPS